MQGFQIRTCTLDDIPQIMKVQRAYKQRYPDAVVIPGELYISESFDHGQNVFCGFDEQGSLQGYAPVLPNLILAPHTAPHTVWAEVKVHPELKPARRLRDLLFARVRARTQDITRLYPGHGTRLTFQYAPSETASISYVLSKGCHYAETVFRMCFDLSQELPHVSPPLNIKVRRWHMDTEAGQEAYVQARNEAFPEAAITLADWQTFTRSPLWQVGTSITAFDGPEIVGSVAAYWDEAENGQTGKRIGYTEYIFVRAAWRKRGIAAYLICQALQYLQEHGRTHASLEVRAANESALGLYQRLGYRVVGETRLFVQSL